MELTVACFSRLKHKMK